MDTEKMLEKIEELYFDSKYNEIINLVEFVDECKNNEKIIDMYLWSLWYVSFDEGTKEGIKAVHDRCEELAEKYDEKFGLNKWYDLFQGQSFLYQCEYWFALCCFASLDDKYEYDKLLRERFEPYDELYAQGKFLEVINYYKSIFLYGNFIRQDITLKYVFSLYFTGNNEKALDEWNNYQNEWEKYSSYEEPEEQWFFIGGCIKRTLGNNAEDIQLLEDAISLFRKANEKETIEEIKQEIKDIKEREKERERNRKEAERERIAEEKEAERERERRRKEAERERSAAQKEAEQASKVMVKISGSHRLITVKKNFTMKFPFLKLYFGVGHDLNMSLRDAYRDGEMYLCGSSSIKDFKDQFFSTFSSVTVENESISGPPYRGHTAKEPFYSQMSIYEVNEYGRKNNWKNFLITGDF